MNVAAVKGGWWGLVKECKNVLLLGVVILRFVVDVKDVGSMLMMWLWSQG